MDNICGSRRVIGEVSLPVYAWQLDNKKIIMDDEMLIKVSKVHIEPSSFTQMCVETGGQEDLIKETIMNMVKLRGKIHNPYTETAGLIGGVVEKIGKKCENKKNLKPGDEVLIIISASMIPAHLDRVTKVNFAYGNIDAEGYAIVYDRCPIVKKDKDVSWDLLLVAFEESASIYNVSKLVKNKENIMILGSNLIVSMFYGLAARKTMSPDGKLVGLCYSDEINEVLGTSQQKLNKLLYSVFDEVYFMDVASAIECADVLTQNSQRYFDVVVNCADKSGAEAVSVLITKKKGSVFFSNLSNKYNTALFIQESLNREMDLICAAGYYDGYDDFMLEFLRENGEQVAQVGYAVSELYQTENKIIELSSRKEPEKAHMIWNILNYNSASTRALATEIDKAGRYDCSVVITGESGVGKEIIANLIYQMSDRKTKPYIKINCAAIPDSLMESEFFGYEKGAFTGANDKGKAGYFSMANGGMLLLDEITELSVEMQAKLLRVLQEGEFYPVGGEKPVRVDVRVIATTNRDLKKLLSAGKFREDLYYRLAVITLEVPPMRERTEDIVALTKVFLEGYSQKYGREIRITDEALQYWVEYDWPGNVRQLENAVHRLYIDAESDVIGSNNVLKYLNKFTEATMEDEYEGIEQGGLESFNQKVEAYERRLIEAALKRFGTTRKAAESLGMTQSQLMRKKQKLGI